MALLSARLCEPPFRASPLLPRFAPNACTRTSSPSRDTAESGLTLIELVLVVVLIGLLGTFAVTRLDSALGWKQEGEIRKLANVLQFLHRQSRARGVGYRILFDIRQNSYRVFRERQPDIGEAVQVDYLKNLRVQSEKERRAEAEIESMPTLEEQFMEEDSRAAQAVENRFFDVKYSDPHRAIELRTPLEFPSLSNSKQMPAGLELVDVAVRGQTISDGETFVRFLPRGVSEFVVIHLRVDEQWFTLVQNPSSGDVTTFGGKRSFSWSREDELDEE